MSENLVSDRRPVSSLLSIFLLLIFGFVVLGPVIGMVTATLVYGTGFVEGLMNPLAHPEYSMGILLAQGIGATIGLLILPWFYLKNFEKRSVFIFFKDDVNWPVTIVTLMIVTVTFAIAISPVIDWNANIEFPEWASDFGDWAKQTEKSAADLIKSITDNMTAAGFVLAFVVVAIIPGIGEELFFRGMIQNEFQRAFKNHHAAIWITAIIFSAFHMQFMGFVPRVLLGAMMGYLYVWSGNLWVPVITHFFNNGIQLVGLYLYQKGVITFDVESTETAPLPAVGVGIVLTIFLLVFLKNYFKRQATLRDSAQ